MNVVLKIDEIQMEPGYRLLICFRWIVFNPLESLALAEICLVPAFIVDEE